MSRSTGAGRAERLNAAFDLLAQGCAPAQAADMLAEGYGLSRRQAYRYVQEAQAIKRPVPIAPVSVAITVKVPEHVALQLRSHANATGSTIGDVVARAVLGLLARERRRA
jgi:predicted DNA-binding transcriptional regulator YafY